MEDGKSLFDRSGGLHDIGECRLDLGEAKLLQIVDETSLLGHFNRVLVPKIGHCGVIFFSDESDLDLVVDFLPGAETTLWDLATLASELEVLTGRRVDLHTLRGVEQDRNRLRRSRILETMVPIYSG